MNESSPTSADMEPQSSPEADQRRVSITTTSTNAPTNNKTWFIFRLLASSPLHWPDVALVMTLALLPCLFFWRLITPNPADRMVIAAGDFTEQYFPLRAFTAQAWVRGQLPLWNPYLYGGQPALADIQSGALYPPHVLEAFLLGWGGSVLGQEIGFPLWALEWQIIVHFSLAAVGTYLFARSCFIRSLSPPRLASPRAEPEPTKSPRGGFALAQRGPYGPDEALSPRLTQSSVSLRRARFGGVIASLVFTYGGYLTGFPVQQITILEVSAWLPWVMWAVSAAAGRPPTADPFDTPFGRRAGHRPPNDNISRLLASLLPRSSALFWGALAFAMAILAGHPQTVLYIFYLSLAYTLFRAFNDSTIQRLSEPPRPTPQSEAFPWDAPERSLPLGRFTLHASRFLRSLIPWFIIILLGAAIASAQLLPTLEFIAHSLRADLSYQAVSAGLPLNEFISILYPGFLGGSPEYVGIVPLVLIALALTITSNLQYPKGTMSPISNTPRARCLQSQDIFFWAGAGLVGLLLAFGGNTFLYPLFYLLTPGFEAVRQQERAFLVYSFSAAMLAGYGALVLAGPLPKLARSGYTLFERHLRQVAIVALALTAFFIYGSAVATARGDEVNLFYGVLWQHLFGLVILGGMLVLLILRSRRWLRRTWAMSLVTLWLAFNLFTVNWRFNLEKPTIPPPFTPNGVTNFLQTNLPTLWAEPEPTKWPADEVAQRGQAKVPYGQDEAFQPSNPPTLQSSNLPPMGRIVSGGLLPGGNSAASIYNLQDLTGNTPLQLAAVDTFLQQMPAWRAWQLLNVRYIIDSRNIADAGLALVFEEGDLKVFEMGDPFPRAWFVAGTEVVADEGQALARLASDEFDLRHTAIVVEPLDLPPSDPTASTVTVVDSGPTHLTAEVNASDQQLLVFSQIYYPGWQAKIDGQTAELLPVNMIQQGVVVPAGQHTVQLSFSPRSFWVGTVISITAVLICLILLIWCYKRSKFQA